MPIATAEAYAEMFDNAKAGGVAYPAINVTSSETVNAAIKGFADANSDTHCHACMHTSSVGNRQLVAGRWKRQ